MVVESGFVLLGVVLAGLSVALAFSSLTFPSHAFAFERDPAKAMRVARFIMAIVYFGLACLLLYLLYNLFYRDRVEAMESLYKVGSIEAPSVAVCPFWPGTTIIEPEGLLAKAKFYSPDGVKEVELDPKKCSFDRTCICVNIEAITFRDHAFADTRHLGTMGDQIDLSQNQEMEFNDRLELQTWLHDPSLDHVLKFGFYDSVDLTPYWFYAHEDSYVTGTLALNKWVVQDIRWATFMESLKTMTNKLWQERSIYHYESQEILYGQDRRSDTGTEKLVNAAANSTALLHRTVRHRANGVVDEGLDAVYGGSTVVAYSMASFFITETHSSETVVSFFSIMVVCLLLAAQVPAVRMLKNTLFPEHIHNLDTLWEEHRKRRQAPGEDRDDVRNLSGFAKAFGAVCCCWCCERSAEEQALLG
jgi:hypothetical protein